MNRATKALNRYRSDLWETQYYCADRGRAEERRWHKRGAARAMRRLSLILIRESSVNSD